MQVICIDASKGRLDGVKPPFCEGEEISVMHASERDYFDLTYESGAWDKSRFIPLSEIDEMELIREKEMA